MDIKIIYVVAITCVLLSKADPTTIRDVSGPNWNRDRDQFLSWSWPYLVPMIEPVILVPMIGPGSSPIFFVPLLVPVLWLWYINIYIVYKVPENT